MERMKGIIKHYKDLLKVSADKDVLMNELYREYKKYARKYYNGQYMAKRWNNLLKELVSIESEYFSSYIIDTRVPSLADDKISSLYYLPKHESLRDLEIEEVLDYIVYCGRRELVQGDELKAYNNLDVTNYCKIASNNIATIALNCGIEYYVIRIDPGFSSDYELFGIDGFHYFDILKYKDKYYLVDITYKQFFIKSDSYLERLGVPETYLPSPGIYMTLNEERKRVANVLLKRGWIELTPDVVKAYFDGFAISYRNGLYYENHDLTFETDYTSRDYKNFLTGEDNQVNHEGMRVLGYQIEPLKNPKMKFNP